MQRVEGRSAAEFLFHARSSGSKVEDIPEAFRPRSVADGYQIQDELLLLLNEPVVGWFVALTSPEMQRIHRAEEPIYGRILKSNIKQPGAVVLADLAMPVSVEAEIAFRFRKALVPRHEGYADSDVADSVMSVAPVIELVGSRFIDMTAIPLASLISDNGTDGFIVMGEEIDFSPLAGIPCEPIELTIDNCRASLGDTTRAMGNPLRACTWLANQFCKMGRTIYPGEVIVTGNCLERYCFASSGQTIRADFGALGTVVADLVSDNPGKST